MLILICYYGFMAKKINTETIAKATGKSWEDWLNFFEFHGASKLTHKEIVKIVMSETDTGGWWAQNVTVAYEQHIGRRQPGEDHRGVINTSTSKTVGFTRSKAAQIWQGHILSSDQIDGIPIKTKGKLSETDKWHYMRLGLDDGSKVVFSASETSSGKTRVSVMHEHLASHKDAEKWKSYWQQALTKMFSKDS